MGVRFGNKIDYRGVAGMDNADEEDNPKMGFMGGGFGGPGVRENKQVGASSEIVIPVKQSFIIAVGTAGLLFAIYVVTKIFIVDRADWSLLIGIITLCALPISGFYLIRFVQRYVYSIVFDMGRYAFIVTWVVILVILVLITDFYVSVIVPQATLTLDQEAHVVFLVCAVVGWLVAYKPFKRFFVNQLTNSLRDSDSKYAIQSLLLEDYWRRREAGIIDGEYTVEEDEPEPQRALLGHHIIANPAAGRTFKPGTEDLAFEMMVNEFLDGIESKDWSTSERSWKGKRLVRSGVDLPVVGDEIRESLLSGHWAEWVHPNQPNQGWRLSASISQIRGSAFAKSRVPKKQLVAPIVETL